MIDKMKIQGVYNLSDIKVPGVCYNLNPRIKGKTVQVRHMSAIAVIGDENCSMSLFVK